MSIYAQVQDGEVVGFDLPTTGTLPDGSQVSGFDKLDPETLKIAGWIPIEDAGPPNHDHDTKKVERTFKIKEDKVIAVYTVSELPLPEPTLESVASLQDQFNELINILVSKETITEDELTSLKEFKPPKP